MMLRVSVRGATPVALTAVSLALASLAVAQPTGSRAAAGATLTCKRAGSGIFIYDKNLGGSGTWRSVFEGTAGADTASFIAGAGGGASFADADPFTLTAVNGRCRRTTPDRVAFRKAVAAAFVADTGAGNDHLDVDLGRRTHPTWATIRLGPGDDRGTLLGRPDGRGATNDPFQGSLDGGPGNDQLRVESQTISADPEDDYSLKVFGASGNDVIVGGAGAETISGGDGNDRVDAATGDDDIDVDGALRRPTSGRDDDVVLAGAGDDRVIGGAGADIVDLGPGDDVFELSNHDGGPADASRATVDCGPGDDSVLLPDGSTLAATINCEHVAPTLLQGPEPTGPFFGAIAETDRQGRGRDHLDNDDIMVSNHFLTSRAGAYRLLLSAYGELTIYDAQNQPVWTSHTRGGHDRRHQVGNLHLYGGRLTLDSQEATPIRIWNATGANQIVLQDDGSVVAQAGDRVVRTLFGLR